MFFKLTTADSVSMRCKRESDVKFARRHYPLNTIFDLLSILLCNLICALCAKKSILIGIFFLLSFSFDVVGYK